MLVYNVTYTIPQENVTGRGRVKSSDYGSGFTVLCRSSVDAARCFHWHFYNVYKKSHINDFEASDCEVIYRRSKVDSRNFDFNYLLMDKMKSPLVMTDVSRNVLRLNEIF